MPIPPAVERSQETSESVDLDKDEEGDYEAVNTLRRGKQLQNKAFHKFIGVLGNDACRRLTRFAYAYRRADTAQSHRYRRTEKCEYCS